MDIESRIVPQRWLATIGRELLSTQVQEFMQESLPRLLTFAASHPGLRSPQPSDTEPIYAIYHGVIGPTRKVLVELAIVIGEEVAPATEIHVRREPPHSEAHVTIRREDVSHTRLVHIYRELAAWVYAHGTPHLTCPPREVYVTNLDAAHVGDIVGAVAYPYTPMARNEPSEA